MLVAFWKNTVQKLATKIGKVLCIRKHSSVRMQMRNSSVPMQVAFQIKQKIAKARDCSLSSSLLKNGSSSTSKHKDWTQSLERVHRQLFVQIDPQKVPIFPYKKRAVSSTMKAQVCLLFLVLCPIVFAFQKHDLENLLHDFIRRESRCYQETPNCNDCLGKEDCSWCSDGVVSQCTSSSLCPKDSTVNECPNPKPVLDNRNEENTDFSQEVLSFPSSLGDDSRNISCFDRKNCSFCTSSSSCSWCESKRTCFQYSSPTSAKTICGSDLWYKDQCLYSCKYFKIILIDINLVSIIFSAY